VKLLGMLLGIAGVVCCLLVLRARRTRLEPDRTIRLGFVTLPAVAFYKLVAFAGLLVFPVATAFVANYHVFEGSKEVSSCASCHATETSTHVPSPRAVEIGVRQYTAPELSLD
jgi:hypothetical protein